MRRVIVSMFLAVMVVAAFAQDEPYASRHQKLLDLTEKGMIIIANTGEEDYMGQREHLNFYYLTGLSIKDAILVIDRANKKSLIYRPAPPRYARQTESTSSFEEKNLVDFEQDLSTLLRQHKAIWMDLSQVKLLEKAGWALNRVGSIENVTPLIHGMRSVKDEHEIKILTKAIEITANGLIEMMKSAEPGMNEKELEMMLKYTFELQGSKGLGFGIQAASGPNGTYVHYSNNDRTTQEGDMMVFDVGAKYENYTADISRSFPISGKFTSAQKDIYKIVLNAQKNAIKKMIAGADFGKINMEVADDLNAGLAELGLITDLNKEWQQRFWIQHGWSHHIGLLVHDVSGPYTPGEADLLKPGMIYTLEPGLYFPENYLRKDNFRARRVQDEEWEAFIKKVEPIFKKYINIGVRIEDDVLITNDGNKVLSKAVPKEIKDIEKLMKEKGKFRK